ncbi:MAG: ORF6N domain-containing protein [Fimbriimonas sp.]
MSYRAGLQPARTSMIQHVRATPVIFDEDLAALYGVSTKQLNQAVKRNENRFPEDFSFKLTQEEWKLLRSQNVTSNEGRGGRRYPPRVFTEHGVTMMAALLNSERAVDMSIMVVREFVRMRHEASAYAELARKIDALEMGMGKEFSEVWKVIRALVDTPPSPPRKMGFRQVREKRK